MRKRWPLLVLITVVLFAGGVLLLTPREEMAVVQGRRTSDWAMELLGPAPTEPAENVVRSFSAELAPDLIKLLRHHDSLLREPINTIARFLPRRLGVALHRTFKPNQPARHRLAAVLALGLMGTNAVTATPELSKALRDPDSNIRMYAAMALTRVGPVGIPGLIQALDDPSRRAREAAMGGLVQLGSDASPAISKLIHCLRTPNDTPFAHAALKSIGKPAVPALIELLSWDDLTIQCEAVRILGKIGSPARGAIPPILALAHHPAFELRRHVMTSLGRICFSCDSVPATLREALNDSHRDVRIAAAAQLRSDERIARETVTLLISDLRSGIAAKQASAVEALGRMGAWAVPAIPEVKAWQNLSAENSTLAEEAIRRIQNAAASTARGEIGDQEP
ncbi:MAG: HEAT repeat domain-containing protein [Pedosphaera sp.]|nr:HEAT repeat domain-containing protein [Pedosphaera sp.]